MITKTIIVSLILSVLSANGMPPAKSVNPFRVRITVNSDTHQSIIKSYLSREFRQLGDVEVVYDKPKYELSVIHINGTQSQSNCFSVVVTSIISESWLADSAPNHHLLAIGRVSHHELLAFYSDIKKACAEIVAEIDVDVFEHTRQIHQEIEQIIRESK